MYKQITSNCSPQKHFFYKLHYFEPVSYTHLTLPTTSRV